MLKKIEKKCQKCRVAFSHIDGSKWTAGTYYLKNLFIALQSLPEDESPEIVLIVSNKKDQGSFEELAPYVNEVVEFTHQEIVSWISRFLHPLLRFEKLRFVVRDPFTRFLNDNEINVYFTRGAPPQHCGIPVISWIPDYQHKHFPKFFSQQEIRSRDISNANAAIRATRVVLSSNSALVDYRLDSSISASKGRVLSFVAQIDDDIYQSNVVDVCSKYHIPERFILLPNQFWKHKNHRTVIRALSVAVNQNPELVVVCTGNTNEYRDDQYFSKLLCELSEAGLREQMILLGLVPRQDLLALMRQSIAVLQPSQFEGWNTTIEEAKTLGKRVIASDIPVHFEQGDDTVSFFPVENYEKLATLLLEVFNTIPSGPDEKLEKKAKSRLNDRTLNYGSSFMGIIKEING